MKISLKEWNEFINSEWETEDDYIIFSEAYINGIELEDIPEEILEKYPESTEVNLKGGLCEINKKEVPLLSYFKKYKKSLTHETVVLTVPKDKVQILKDFAKELNQSK